MDFVVIYMSVWNVFSVGYWFVALIMSRGMFADKTSGCGGGYIGCRFIFNFWS